MQIASYDEHSAIEHGWTHMSVDFRYIQNSSILLDGCDKERSWTRAECMVFPVMSNMCLRCAIVFS